MRCKRIVIRHWDGCVSSKVITLNLACLTLLFLVLQFSWMWLLVQKTIQKSTWVVSGDYIRDRSDVIVHIPIGDRWKPNLHGRRSICDQYLSRNWIVCHRICDGAKQWECCWLCSGKQYAICHYNDYMVLDWTINPVKSLNAPSTSVKSTDAQFQLNTLQLVITSFFEYQIWEKDGHYFVKFLKFILLTNVTNFSQ